MANRNKNVMRGKGKKPYKSRNEKFSDAMEAVKGASCSPNDLSWYVVDDQILNDAARIPYSIPVGMPFTRNGSFTPHPDLTLPAYDDAIPGLMVSWIVPLLGNAHDPSDAVNVAANSVYQYVRSRISGSRPYDAVDMMIYLGAMDSVFCYVTYLTRLYATVFTYHQANRYMSRALIEAQNVDYDDLVSNLSQFRAAINVRIAKIKSLYLPSVLPLFKRHSWLFSTYYIEGDSEKDQIYFHAPAGIHHFKYDNDNAGMLECYNLMDQTPITTQGLINLLDALINPIYQDEDFNRISGDFLKAYEGNVFSVSEIPDIATINLVHSEEVLLQFKNAKYKYVVPVNDRIPFFNYTQDSNKVYLQMTRGSGYLQNYLEVTPTENKYVAVDASSLSAMKVSYSSELYDWSKPTLLTSPHKDVVPGESMINTRLTLAFSVSGDSTAVGYGKIDDMYFGSEWPIKYDIFCYHKNKSTGVLSLFSRFYDSHMYVGVDANPLQVESWVLSQEPIRTAFKYLPELTLIWNSNYGSPARIIDPGRSHFEVDNYAVVDSQVISGLHNAAILGEYAIPKLAIGK